VIAPKSGRFFAAKGNGTAEELLIKTSGFRFPQHIIMYCGKRKLFRFPRKKERSQYNETGIFHSGMS
jgi:hypothetical protein